MSEGIALLVASFLCVAIGTWFVGELSPKIRGRVLSNAELLHPSNLKHDVQRTALRWFSFLAASVVGAYKSTDVVDRILEAIR